MMRFAPVAAPAAAPEAANLPTLTTETEKLREQGQKLPDPETKLELVVKEKIHYLPHASSIVSPSGDNSDMLKTSSSSYSSRVADSQPPVSSSTARPFNSVGIGGRRRRSRRCNNQAIKTSHLRRIRDIFWEGDRRYDPPKNNKKIKKSHNDENDCRDGDGDGVGCTPQTSTTFKLGKRLILKKIHDSPHIYTIDGFLTESELTHIHRRIQRAERERRFQRSFVDIPPPSSLPSSSTNVFESRGEDKHSDDNEDEYRVGGMASKRPSSPMRRCRIISDADPITQTVQNGGVLEKNGETHEEGSSNNDVLAKKKPRAAGGKDIDDTQSLTSCLFPFVKPGGRLEVLWHLDAEDGIVENGDTYYWWGATLLPEATSRRHALTDAEKECIHEEGQGLTAEIPSIPNEATVQVLKYDPYPQGGYEDHTFTDVLFLGASALYDISNVGVCTYRCIHDKDSRDGNDCYTADTSGLPDRVIPNQLPLTTTVTHELSAVEGVGTVDVSCKEEVQQAQSEDVVSGAVITDSSVPHTNNVTNGSTNCAESDLTNLDKLALACRMREFEGSDLVAGEVSCPVTPTSSACDGNTTASSIDDVESAFSTHRAGHPHSEQPVVSPVTSGERRLMSWRVVEDDNSNDGNKIKLELVASDVDCLTRESESERGKDILKVARKGSAMKNKSIEPFVESGAGLQVLWQLDEDDDKDERVVVSVEGAGRKIDHWWDAFVLPPDEDSLPQRMYTLTQEDRDNIKGLDVKENGAAAMSPTAESDRADDALALPLHRIRYDPYPKGGYEDHTFSDVMFLSDSLLYDVDAKGVCMYRPNTCSKLELATAIQPCRFECIVASTPQKRCPTKRSDASHSTAGKRKCKPRQQEQRKMSPTGVGSSISNNDNDARKDDGETLHSPEEKQLTLKTCHRTSTFIHFSKADGKSISAIERRAGDLLGLSTSCIEPIQLVRYNVGDYFGQHHDLGTLRDDGTVELPTSSLLFPPRRLVTVFVYLNNVEESCGGATRFPLLKQQNGDKSSVLEVRPKRGMALLFCNIRRDGHPDPLTVHEGLPLLDRKQLGSMKAARRRANVVKYGINVWACER